MEIIASNAKKASLSLQSLPTETKNKALGLVKQALVARKDEILAANKRDLQNAEVAMKSGDLSSALFKRLDICGPNDSKFLGLLAGLDDVISLEDPVGKVTLATRLHENLDMYRVTCPVGVLCIIFEARPEVNIQVSALALKSGNAVILKGGKEATESNKLLVSIFRDAIAQIPEIPIDAVQCVESREAISELLKLDHLIDLVIPRGSNDLVRHIKNSTRIPVLGHADGICSVYIDQSADVKKAVTVAVDAKTSYVAACNTAETLLVNREALPKVGLDVLAALLSAKVKLHADQESTAAMQSDARFAEFFSQGNIVAATEADYRMEYLDYQMAVKVVASVQEAVEHINSHGSHHTDSIITESKDNAEFFMGRVDSAGVYQNASTRFADGFRYGFGAEIGVSTNKTHARGPVGLEGLVIYKYRIYGQGHASAQFGSTAGLTPYMHKPIEPKLPQ